MKTVQSQKENCNGCGACKVVCARKAVTMLPDDEGFLYPAIDETECIDCKLCLEVCPQNWSTNFKENVEPRYYLAKHKDEGVLLASSSGGAFTAISDYFLQRGGAVYGADYDCDFRVFHNRAVNAQVRDRFRISKYVQSETGESFSGALCDLGAGLTALFSGTPCQTAGIRALAAAANLRRNLYTCDVICHGIPSPLVWRDYLRLLEKEHGGRIADVRFRSKKLAWSRVNTYKTFEFKTTENAEYLHDRRFYKLYFKLGTIMRPSCYACKYADTKRAADITIADYWGIEKFDSELYDPRGVSVVLINSDKGREILDYIDGEMYIQERPAGESLAEQPRLREAAGLPPSMDRFWRDYKQYGIEYVLSQEYR